MSIGSWLDLRTPVMSRRCLSESPWPVVVHLFDDQVFWRGEAGVEILASMNTPGAIKAGLVIGGWLGHNHVQLQA